MANNKDENGAPAMRVPVASIGASAGGVAALQSFFEALPQTVGAAFVVIVHLDPEHSSELTHIIATRTKMPVIEVTHEQLMRPDTVYVIPPNRRLLVSAEKVSSTSPEASERRSISFSARSRVSMVTVLPSS